MAGDFDVIVGVEVEDSKLDALKQSINNINKKKSIKIDIDTSDAHKKITDLENHIKKLNNVRFNINTSQVQKAGTVVGRSINEIQRYSAKPIKINADASDVNTVVSSIEKQMRRLDGLKIEPNTQVAATYKELKRTLGEIASLEKKIGKPNIGANELKTYESQLKTLTNTYDALRDKLKTNLAPAQTGELNNVIEKTGRELEQLSSKIVDTKNKLRDGLTLKFDNGGFETKLRKLTTDFGNITDKSGKVKSEIKELGAAYNNLRTAINSGDVNKIISANEKWANTYERVENKLKDATRAQKQLNDVQKQMAANTKLENSKNLFGLQIDRWLDDNSAAVSKFGGSLENLKSRIAACDDVGQLNNLKSEFAQITTQAKLAGETGLNFVDRLRWQLSKFSAYIGIASVFMYTGQAIRSMAQNVLEVDTAMTELYRVTDLTATQYDGLYDRLVVSAKEYGATLTDLISATADWSRAGFDADVAAGLAEVTTMYQHIADLDYQESFENLMTSYKGFEDQLKSENMFGDDTVAAVSYIGDILNELDNNYAVTAAGVGEAMKRSASALNVAGNSIQETAAMVTGVTEVTQDPEKAGNALKVVSMRVRGMKGALEEMGEETDENVENISKMQGQILNLTHGKVNIFDSTGEFKSTYEIMQGIAKVWKDLSSIEQADLLETIAGKHRANDIASLVGNWENVEKALVSATNATGSAEREHAKYVDSLQGRLNSLQATWQAFSQTVMSSDFLKGLVSAGDDLLKMFDGIIDTVGMLPALLAAAGIAMSVKGTGFFKVIEDESKKSGQRIQANFVDAFKAIASRSPGQFAYSGTFTQGLNSDITALRKYAELVRNGIEPTSAFKMAMGNASVSAQKFAESIQTVGQASGKNFGKSLRQFTDQQKQIEVATQAQNKSFANSKSLIAGYNTSMQSAGLTQRQYAQSVAQTNPLLGKYLSGLNGARAGMTGYIASLIGAKAATLTLEAVTIGLNMALTMGIGLIISGVVSAISDWIHANEKLAESVNEVTSSYNDQHSSLIQGKGNFEEIAKSYEKLSKGVDQLTGKNVSLMPEEYEEYQSVVNQIADTIPSLVKGYDEQGNAILNCAGDVDTLTDAYNNLIIAENNKLLNGDGKDFKGMSDVLDDFANDYKALESTGFAGNEINLTGANSLEDILNLDVKDINKDSIAKYTGNLTHQIGNSLKQEMSKQELTLDGVDITPNALSTRDEWNEYIAEVCKQHPEVARTIIKNFDTELDEAAKETRDSINAYMENAFLQGDYSNINNKMQTVVSSIVNSLDSEFLHSIVGDLKGDEAKAALETWIDNFLGALDGLGVDAQEKLTSAFDLQGKFANNELSLGEYKSQLEEAAKMIDGIEGLDEEVKTELKVELNTEGVQDEWQSFVNRMTESGMDYNVAVNFANSLNSYEWEAARHLVVEGNIDWKNKTPDEIKDEIASLADVAEAMSFTIDIEGETERIDAVNTALAESVSAAGLSVESLESLKKTYASLDNYDPSKLFEKTSQGIRVNVDELNKLEESLAKQNLDDVTDSISELEKAYGDVTEKLRTCNNEADRVTLLDEQASYADRIAELEEMQAQYEGLTSAYKAWVDAQEAGEEGDIYDNAESMFEDAKELYEKGLVGTNEFAAATEFLTGKDTSGMNPSKIAAEWENAADKMERYFTKDKEGNQTSDGVNNLLTDISKLNKEWAHLNENDEWEIDMSVEDVSKAAEELGVSAELIEAVLGKGADYGLEINYDSVYDAAESLETMRTEAEAANDKLVELGYTDVKFSFESDDIDDLNTQIEKAKTILDKFRNEDGTINVEAKGAKEAQAVLAALISQKQEVSEPEFMKVSVATIGDEKLGSVIQTLQTFQTYKNISDINIAIGADNTDAQAKISETLTKLQSLKNENPQVFADLGLDTTEFNNALNTLSGNVKAGVELDSNALSTVQSALQGVNATVLANVGIGDTSAVDGYTPQNANGTVDWKNDTSVVDSWIAQSHTANGTINWGNNTENVKTNFTATGTINWKNSGGGNGTPANGTANPKGAKASFADGTNGKAFKRGDWGVKGSGVALGGELGQELVVRDGHYFTIGDKGAEFFKYQPNDIIFNAEQTRQLFEQGKIVNGKTRGRALADGNAYADGIAFATGVSGGGKLHSSKKKSSSSSKSSSSKSSSSKKSSSKKSSSKESSLKKSNKEAEKFEETLDWIEIKIDRIERAISKLDLTASSIFKTWGTRNNALSKQIGKVSEEINIQQKGYNRYIKQANKVGLSSSWAKKVREGKIDIQTIKNEKLAEKIKEYQEW